MLKTALLLVVSIVHVGSATAQRRVLVVKPGPYPTLAAAVQAARDGDTILIDTANNGRVVTSKALTILGGGSFGGVIEFHNVTGPIEVRNLRPFGNQRSLLRFRQCTGPILVSDCALFGVYIEDGPSATFADCSILQGGALFLRSNVSLWESTIEAGQGYCSPGLPGVQIVGGSLFASGCGIQGGEGQPEMKKGAPPYTSFATHGGDALTCGQSGQATLVDCVLTPGLGGMQSNGSRKPSGSRIQRGAWSIRELSGPRRGLTAIPIPRPGGTWTIEVATQANDVLALAIGPVMASATVPNVVGNLNLDLSLAAIWIPGQQTGKARITRTMPSLPAGLDSIEAVVQGLVLTANAELLWTNPRGLTLLHGRF